MWRSSEHGGAPYPLLPHLYLLLFPSKLYSSRPAPLCCTSVDFVQEVMVGVCLSKLQAQLFRLCPAGDTDWIPWRTIGIQSRNER